MACSTKPNLMQKQVTFQWKTVQFYLVTVDFTIASDLEISGKRYGFLHVIAHQPHIIYHEMLFSSPRLSGVLI